MKNRSVILLLAVFTLSACSLFSFFSTKVPTATKLVGENLSGARGLRGSSSARELNPDMFYITPSNAAGKVITVSLMVGDEGGSALFLITPAEEGFKEASVNSDSDALVPFDLTDPLTVDAEMTVDADRYPSDEEAIVSRIEMLFGWIDLEFALDGNTALGSGAQTVRIVFADVPDLGYSRGDLLYSDNGEFKWVDAGSSHELSATRPADPVQLEKVASYAGTQDGMGNQSIPAFMTTIAEAERFSLKYDELTSNAWEFSVVFDMTDGIELGIDPSTVTSPYELLSNFDILADIDSGGSQGFGARVEAVNTAL